MTFAPHLSATHAFLPCRTRSPANQVVRVPGSSLPVPADIFLEETVADFCF